MYLKNAKDLMQRLEFPTNAQEELLSKLDTLLNLYDFLEIVNRYNTEDFDFSKALEDTKNLALNHNVCEYTAYMLLLICKCPVSVFLVFSK